MKRDVIRRGSQALAQDGAARRAPLTSVFPAGKALAVHCTDNG